MIIKGTQRVPERLSVYSPHADSGTVKIFKKIIINKI